jgi:hypothetical protein
MSWPIAALYEIVTGGSQWLLQHPQHRVPPELSLASACRTLTLDAPLLWDKRWTRILLPLSATTIVVAGATLTKEPKAKLRGDELLPPDSG